jgi:membrane-associated protein
MFLDVINWLLDALTNLSPTVLYLLTGLFTALETSALVGLVIPGDAVVLLAGTTATSPARFAALVGVAVAGSLTGESVGYLLGRRYGDRLRSSRLGRSLGERNWAKAERFLNGRGGHAVFAARFVAVVHALLPVVAGAVRMPYRRFVGWAAAGSLVWSVLYVGAGVAAGASWREYGDRLGMAGYVAIGVLLAGVLLTRTLRRRDESSLSSSSASEPDRPEESAPSRSPVASRSCIPRRHGPSAAQSATVPHGAAARAQPGRQEMY